MQTSIRILTLALSSLIFACASADDASTTDTTAEDLTKACATSSNGPVQGVDVSKFQGAFNWNHAVEAFGYARVGYGTTLDPDFETDWKNMATAGVKRGAYQYFRPSQDTTAQANFVIGKVGTLGSSDMPAVIDVEVNEGVSPTALAAEVKLWLTLVEAGTGKTPMIYTGAYFWQDHVKDTTFGKYPLWIASYGHTCPSLPAGWTKWVLWQYSDGSGKLDHDIFNGNAPELSAL